MPRKQEIVLRPRHQSRRAASKEALKQMQILLDDEEDDDAVEIPDDDDLIPIVSPPKKKYKLTHRKSSDGNDRDVIVLKSITPSITNHYVENNLELECWTEDLEPCQKSRNKTIQDEEKQLQTKLDELISSCSAEIVYKGDLTTVIEVKEQVQKTIAGVQAAAAAAAAAAAQQPNIILNNSVANAPQSYQLVMDPRLGLIVGAVPTTPAQPPPKQLGKVQVATNLQSPKTTQPTPVRRETRARRGKPAPVMTPTPPNPPAPITRSVLATKSQNISKPISVAKPPTVAKPPPIAKPQSVPKPQNSSKQQTVSKPQSAAKQQNTPKPQNIAKPQVRDKSPNVTKLPPAKRLAVSAPAPSPPTPPVTRARQPAVTATTASGPTQSNLKPAETNVEGGLATGNSEKAKAVVDLTTDDGRPLPDSREISFNKLQGKTFPSLVVVARPHLRVLDVNSDRPKLDAKVKSVLMHAPTKFTEWLIQQGLVRSEQKCSIHSTTQLKLGMYSDVSKFPYSGGYVWISECCPQRFVSVFSGSLFEGSPHPPLVILKLLYHWACQTNIQNVTQWVKVDNLYVKGMYTWLRSVCTVALQTHIRQLGGPHTKVEVGVISLGTTSQDGNSRQVKVEVLGILETSSKLIRLRAVEPLADGDRNYKKRFSKILEPLAQWVHPNSIIITDLTVDKATLIQMGFSHVVQTTSSDANNSNRTIMEYLRRIVPRMFQNTLSLLSRQIIQQFLDELVWREWFGTTSLQAFDNLVIHLSEQTRFETSQSLIVRLNKVAMNPFKNWAIQANNNAPSKVVDNSKKRKRKEPEPPKVQQNITVDVNRPPKSTSPDVPEQMVPLENYYYGTIDNYPPKTNVTLNMKCPFCKEMFNNNIVLMNHLFKHAHNVSKDGQMCRYCLTSVPTANDLLKHIATSHPAETKFDNGFVCLICETQYMNPFVLGKHMSKEHCPSELPYQCGTCGYRCSNHKQAIDHFYKQHDNGPTIQCPFCLKSTTVFSSSRNIAQNMNYFIQHLQKHQRKQFARRCGKCNLWFVQKDVLKDHQTKMHASQRGKSGLVPWTAPRNGVMVPKSKMDKYPGDAEVINFNILHFKVTKNLLCKECNTSMDTPKHFPSFESCQNPNCQYSTCCTNAMQEHNARCSKNPNPPVSEEPLPYEMFCVCGYSSKDGNQLAKHLAICERKSAYPSVTDAKTASVTHSMLDVLGLVRKPDENDKKIAEKSKAEPIAVAEVDTIPDEPVKATSEPVQKVEKEPSVSRKRTGPSIMRESTKIKSSPRLEKRNSMKRHEENSTPTIEIVDETADSQVKVVKEVSKKKTRKKVEEVPKDTEQPEEPSKKNSDKMAAEDDEVCVVKSPTIPENNEPVSSAENETDSVVENNESISDAKNEESVPVVENDESVPHAENKESSVSDVENNESVSVAENIESVSVAEDKESDSVVENNEPDPIAEISESVSDTEDKGSVSNAENNGSATDAEDKESVLVAENNESISETDETDTSKVAVENDMSSSEIVAEDFRKEEESLEDEEMESDASKVPEVEKIVNGPSSENTDLDEPSESSLVDESNDDPKVPALNETSEESFLEKNVIESESMETDEVPPSITAKCADEETPMETD